MLAFALSYYIITYYIKLIVLFLRSLFFLIKDKGVDPDGKEVGRNWKEYKEYNIHIIICNQYILYEKNKCSFPHLTLTQLGEIDTRVSLPLDSCVNSGS